MKKKKTLVLCFIHGFMGGEDTFGQDYQFAKDVRELVAQALPLIEVKLLIYPRYETRGDLGEAVARFRAWLQDEIIDLEVAAGTPSPTIDPSVRTVLLGHSMGGILAAETVMALTSDVPVPAPGTGIVSGGSGASNSEGGGAEGARGEVDGEILGTKERVRGLAASRVFDGDASAFDKEKARATEGGDAPGQATEDKGNLKQEQTLDLLLTAAATTPLPAENSELEQDFSSPEPQAETQPLPARPPTPLASHSSTSRERATSAPDLLDPDAQPSEINSLMFPYIQGVLSFDTPYLGIAAGVLAHGAQDHYETVTQAASHISTLRNIWNASSSTAAATSALSSGRRAVAALPAPESAAAAAAAAAKGGRGWATYAITAGVLAGTAAAAYLGRGHIVGAAGYVGAHLQFIGCLTRGAEMRKRVNYMVRVRRELGVGFANLYTRLGRGAETRQSIWTADGSSLVSIAGAVAGNAVATAAASSRTFCNLPKARKPESQDVADQDDDWEESGTWISEVNHKAVDEAGAHMAMFEPKSNSGYKKLVEDTKVLIVRWTTNEWYHSSGVQRLEG